MVRAALVGSDPDRVEALRGTFVRSGGFEVGWEGADGRALIEAMHDDDCGDPARWGIEVALVVTDLASARAWSDLNGLRDARADLVICAVSGILSARADPGDTLPEDVAAFVTGVVRGWERHERRGHLDLPATTASARDARRFLTTLLVEWECGGLVEAGTLLLSELVTNAVLHACSPVTLDISLRAGSVMVEVGEGGGGDVHRVEAQLTSESGRGLAIVDAEASRWGMLVRAGRRVMWFELR